MNFKSVTHVRNVRFWWSELSAVIRFSVVKSKVTLDEAEKSMYKYRKERQKWDQLSHSQTHVTFFPIITAVFRC